VKAALDTMRSAFTAVSSFLVLRNSGSAEITAL